MSSLALVRLVSQARELCFAALCFAVLCLAALCALCFGAGLTRTLGAPSVSVGGSAGAEDEVRVTVAWELTWYQWGVDLGDELRPVYELSKGFEVEEIDAAARQWNASAHDGRIVMVAPRRREAADGKPIHS